MNIKRALTWLTALGGTIDNTVIGGTTAAAGTFTAVTVAQGAADTEVIDLQSTDVSHAVTDNFDANTFGSMIKTAATTGGLSITGITDADAEGALTLRGVIGAADSTDTNAAVVVTGAKLATNTYGAVGDAETIFKVNNHTTTRFRILGDGIAAFLRDTTLLEFRDAAGTTRNSYISSTAGNTQLISEAGNIVLTTAAAKNIYLNSAGEAAGTSASKAIVIGAGVAPTTAPADLAQVWVADFLGTAGDARLHVMGEGSAVAKSVLGSGKVGVTGTTGGMTRHLVEATANIEADASTTIAVNVPSGARILGCQLRVDTALTATELWDAAYAGGATQTIASAQAVAKNTKVNTLFNTNAATDITSDVTTIAITKNGGGSFTAAGTIRAIVYYETFDTMADAA